MTLVKLNVAIGVFVTLVNFAYVLCLICPIQGERTKQPLMLLLGTLVCCTTSFEISTLLNLVTVQFIDLYWLSILSYIAFIFSLSTTTTTSVWLTFFYNTQIVPAKRVVFIWIKKNIKVVIYSVWLFERMLCMFYSTVLIVTIFFGTKYYWVSVNSTMTLEIQYNELPHLKFFHSVSSAVVSSHYYFCMFAMVIFNYSTVIYLCKHMRRMMVNGQPVFSPQLRSQLRVTVTCVLQGAMSMCCTVFSIKKLINQDFFGNAYSNFPLQHFTIIHLYLVGTTLCMGAGQAVFRQRAVNLWRGAVSCCKIRKSDQGA